MIPTDPEARSSLQAEMHVGGGRYLLQRKLGEGGMGSVWVAWDREVGKHYALKFLSGVAAGDLEHWVRLRQEILRAQELRNEHIVGFFDLVVVPGEAPFLKIEYVPGRNLDEIRREQPAGVLAWEWLSPLISQLCDALQHAHDRGIIHCDIKPSNLMVDGFGRLKLADFGIAQVASPGAGAEAGRVFGTKPYMSPQRLSGRMAEPSDDIYAVGATVYELLTGEPPFVGEGATARILEEAPEPIPERQRRLGVANEVPLRVRQVVVRCLEKEAAARPASARELARVLSPLAGVPAPVHPKKSIPARPPPPVPIVVPTVEPAAKRKVGAIWPVVWSLALILAVIGGVWAWKVWHDGPPGSGGGKQVTNRWDIAVADPRNAESVTSELKNPEGIVDPGLGTLQITAWDRWRSMGADRTTFQIRIDRDGKAIDSKMVDHDKPWTVRLLPGDYEVTATMRREAGDNWSDETELTRNVKVTRRGWEQVGFVYSLRELQINVPGVSGAEFRMRSGGSSNPSPAGFVKKVIPGRKRITVSAPGYPTVEEEVLVPDDGAARVVVNVAMRRDPTPQLRKHWARSAPEEGEWARGPYVWLGMTNAAVWLSSHEVTVGEYAAFAATQVRSSGMEVTTANGRTVREDRNWRDPGFPQTDDHPVVGVNWHEATNYCGWLTAKDQAAGLLTPRQRYRLPRVAEFERAAAGLKPGPGMGNLAGGEMTGSAAWNPLWRELAGHRDPYVWTAPVTRSGTPASKGFGGSHDLIGNVAEWCEEVFHAKMNEGKSLAEGDYHLREAGGGMDRVVKGGSWFDGDRDDANPMISGRALPDSRRDTIGFRLALEDESEAARRSQP